MNEPPKTNVWPKGMPWSFKLRGIIVAIFFVFACLFTIGFAHLPAILLIRPLSKKYYRYYANYWAHTWLLWYIFCMEKINKFDFVLTGDEIPKNEFVMAISNHPSEADWLFCFSFANRFHTTGHTKIVMKDIIRKAPGLGWAIENMEFTFLGRDWKRDKPQIVYTSRAYLEYPYNLFVVIFPEGTDYTPAKHERAIQFSKEKNLKFYENLLTPKTKGFKTLVKNLRPRLDAIYDFTIAYDDGVVTPTLWSAWTGFFPNTINIHVKRTPIDQIPTEKTELSNWVNDAYDEKDKLLTNFKKNHKFPGKQIQWDPTSTEVYIFAIVWFALLSFQMYVAFVLRPYWYWIMTIFCWAFFIATSVSPTFQIWRGISPPLDYLPKKQSNKIQ